MKMTVMDGRVDWKLNVELKQLWKFGVFWDPKCALSLDISMVWFDE